MKRACVIKVGLGVDEDRAGKWAKPPLTPPVLRGENRKPPPQDGGGLEGVRSPHKHFSAPYKHRPELGSGGEPLVQAQVKKAASSSHFHSALTWQRSGRQ